MPTLPEKISAVGVTGPRRAELVDVPFDASPVGPNEVAGKSIATLISPGTEVNSGYLQGPSGAEPIIGGYAAVFEATHIGSDVADVAPGDRLMCTGGHRSWQRAARSECVKVPAGLAASHAVFARLLGVSWTTLSTTRARPPARVLITGLGPVGNLAAQLFQASGYTVTAVDPAPVRRELAAAAGLRDVRASAPSAETRGSLTGFHLAVDCSGHEQAVLDACRCIRRGGEVVLVGVPWKRRTELFAAEVLSEVFFRYITLRSGWEWEIPRDDREFANAHIWGNFAGAMSFIAQGRIDVTGLGESRSPADAGTVYEEMANQTSKKLSVAFDWTTTL